MFLDRRPSQRVGYDITIPQFGSWGPRVCEIKTAVIRINAGFSVQAQPGASEDADSTPISPIS